MTELEAFSEKVASLDLKQYELGIALLWYHDHRSKGAERSGPQLAAELNSLGLCGQINVSRFSDTVARSRHIIKGQGKQLRIKLASRIELDEMYAHLLGKASGPPKVDDHLLSNDNFAHSRKYLMTLVNEINGTYQYHFWNSCMVLCRRLMEMLLIESFEKHGKASSIKNSTGEYMGLGDIIAAAQGGHHFKLQRGTAQVLQQIKEAGDAAAHHRTYLTVQRDIDDHKQAYRRIISELMHLAGLDK